MTIRTASLLPPLPSCTARGVARPTRPSSASSSSSSSSPSSSSSCAFVVIYMTTHARHRPPPTPHPSQPSPLLMRLAAQGEGGARTALVPVRALDGGGQRRRSGRAYCAGAGDFVCLHESAADRQRAGERRLLRLRRTAATRWPPTPAATHTAARFTCKAQQSASIALTSMVGDGCTATAADGSAAPHCTRPCLSTMPCPSHVSTLHIAWSDPLASCRVVQERRVSPPSCVLTAALQVSSAAVASAARTRSAFSGRRVGAKEEGRKAENAVHQVGREATSICSAYTHGATPSRSLPVIVQKRKVAC